MKRYRVYYKIRGPTKAYSVGRHFTIVKADSFDARNIGNDADLAGLVQTVERLLEGVNPDDLRDSARLRQHVAEGFNAVKAQLDSMIETAPSRRIYSEED